ncbi:MAG: alpha/beta hydrolase [Flavobacteriales bacterium]|nr:alpha/beta hydrolase [Flavobacteriales bacterium]
MKDLILLHGALGAESQFEALKEALKNDFNVYSFDFEGHGKQESNQDFSMDLFADNLAAFIQQNDLSKPAVFGYSMGGYVSLTLSLKSPELLGEIITLGSKLKWSPEIAQAEIKKINPALIEEKVPKFAAYLDSLHLNWKQNMEKTADMMLGLGDGKALTLEDFSRVKNTVYMGLGELDEMVSREETQEVAKAIGAEFFLLENTKHPLPGISIDLLSATIRERFLKY